MDNPWSQIRKPDSDFNVRLVESQHSLQLYWGLDTSDRYLLILDTDATNLPDKDILPNITGISLFAAREHSRGKLMLRLNETANWELFHALCLDLVRTTAGLTDGPEVGAMFVRRLNRWQDLFKKKRSELLPLELIKGLMGELHVLSEYIAPVFGWDEAVSFWKGPEGAPQDFAVNQTLLEIKCQAGSSKPHVRINSAEQLDPQLSEAYLVVLTVTNANDPESGGLTLNELVDRIRASVETKAPAVRERFEDLLFMAGYVTHEGYEKHRFDVVNLRSFQIRDDFPRIRSRDLSPGIENVSYTLNLNAFSGFESKPGWWRERT